MSTDQTPDTGDSIDLVSMLRADVKRLQGIESKAKISEEEVRILRAECARLRQELDAARQPARIIRMEPPFEGAPGHVAPYVVVDDCENCGDMRSQLSGAEADRDKAQRERDSLARRCALRYEEKCHAEAERDFERSRCAHLAGVADTYAARLAEAEKVIALAKALPFDDSAEAARDVFAAAVDAYRPTPTQPEPDHVYTSTACLHVEHDYCSTAVRDDGGTKVPARCKFCPAPCRCECHGQTDRIRAAVEAREGCCRAAVDSEGFAHDHAEWWAEVKRLRAAIHVFIASGGIAGCGAAGRRLRDAAGPVGSTNGSVPHSCDHLTCH